jgi:hypothetical protein
MGMHAKMSTIWIMLALLGVQFFSQPAAWAFNGSYDKDKYDHAWVKEPDMLGLSLKGFSRDMGVVTMDTMRYMENLPVAPNPSKPRQLWRNLVNNDPTEPIERFGTDVIDVDYYTKRRHKIVYPYQSVEDSLRDNPYNHLDPRAERYYGIRSRAQ